MLSTIQSIGVRADCRAAALKVLLSLCCLTATGAAQTAAAAPASPFKLPPLTWGGWYVGLQRVAPARRPLGPFQYGQFGVTTMVILGIGQTWSTELQLIAPLDGGAPLYRVGVTRRIF